MVILWVQSRVSLRYAGTHESAEQQQVPATLQIPLLGQSLQATVHNPSSYLTTGANKPLQRMGSVFAMRVSPSCAWL